VDTCAVDGVDLDRRAALLLGFAGMSAAVASQGRVAIAQETSAASRQDVRQAVETFVTKYLEIYNKKDAAGLAALYTDDGLLVPPGPITTGRQNIEKAWRAVFDAGRTGLHYDTQQVQAEGNIVWSVGQFTVMAPDESGVLQERQGNFVNIYQWEGDGLKFRVHSSASCPQALGEGPRPNGRRRGALSVLSGGLKTEPSTTWALRTVVVAGGQPRSTGIGRA
jgi:uncharacterized protein (TIGR02246 family)